MRPSARLSVVVPPVTMLGALLVPLLVPLLVMGATAPSYAHVSPAGPDYELPFPCGETWTGSSRADHSPSPLAIDWNRPDDDGAMVVATAPGVVTSVVDLGDRSYGRYIVVDHGNGRTSLYAHLSAFWSTVGESVDQGTPLGLVGSTGNSTGPHLHFEERLDRRDQHAYFHRRSFTMGSTRRSQNCGDTPVVGDWAGTGRADVGVLRRSATPRFVLHRPGRRAWVTTWGWRSDQPVSGDWDGDGRTEVGARRPGLKAFVLRHADGRTTTIRLGGRSDVGLAGDWNGDGRTDVAVWHPSTRVFTLRTGRGRSARLTRLRFGSLGDRPVAGDWNGDGRADTGVYSPDSSTFTLRTVARTGAVRYRQLRWGAPDSLPVAGDWNGDGTTDVGVWQPSTATFVLRLPPRPGHSAPVTRRVVWGAPRG
jgi:hypothetical protein